MSIVNLTPHAIMLYTTAGELVVTFPPSGQVARVSSSYFELPPLAVDSDLLPIAIPSFGEIHGLPAPNGVDVYVVSGMVRSAVVAAGGRGDVIAPDTDAGCVRVVDGVAVVGAKNGVVAGTTRFLPAVPSAVATSFTPAAAASSPVEVAP